MNWQKIPGIVKHRNLDNTDYYEFHFSAFKNQIRRSFQYKKRQITNFLQGKPRHVCGEGCWYSCKGHTSGRAL